MPLNYGSNFPLLPLSSTEVAIYTEAKKEAEDNSLISFLLTGLLTIAETVLSVTGIGAVAAAALGVGFAAARQEINVALTGQEWNWASFGLDAATPFITAVGGRVISGIRGAKLVDTNIDVLERQITTARQELVRVGKEIRSLDKMADDLSINSLTETGRRLQATEFLRENYNAQANVLEASQFARTSNIRVVQADLDSLNALGKFPKLSQVKETIGSLNAARAANIVKSLSHNSTKEIIDRTIENAKRNVENAISKWPGLSAKSEALLDKTISRVSWMAGSIKGSIDKITQIATTQSTGVFLELGIKTVEEGADTAIRNTLLTDRNTTISIIEALEQANIRGISKISELASMVIKMAAKEGFVVSEEAAKAAVEIFAYKQGFIGSVQIAGVARGIGGWFKHNRTEILSLETAQEFVKNIEQLGDFATDIPRHYISKISSKLAKKISDEIKPFKEKFLGIFKNSKRFLKEFERTGGVKVNSNVIVGYKVLSTEGITSQIQITFYPKVTGSNDPKGKNHGGKKPVYVSATITQLVKLREGGMAYYLDTWAISRGGKAANVGGLQEFFNVMPAAAQLGASFVPVQKLAKLVALVSVIARTVKRYHEEGFTKQWTGFLEDTKQKSVASAFAGIGKGIFAVIGMGTVGRMIGSTLSQIGKSALEEGKFDGKETLKKIGSRSVGKVRTYRSKTFKTNASIGRAGKRIYSTSQSVKKLTKAPKAKGTKRR